MLYCSKYSGIRYIAVLLAAVFLTAACSKEKKEAAGAQPVIQSFFSAVDSEFISPTGSPADKLGLISKAVSREKALADFKITGEDSLASAIESLPDQERGVVLLSVLRTMAENLPFGSNSVAGPEGYRLMNDPSRTAGIGLVIQREGPGKFLAVDTLEGSPSHRDNLPTGFYLQEIDGADVSGIYDLEEAVGRIRGAPETKVSVKINDKIFTLNREQVVFQNILSATWKNPENKKSEYILLRSSLPGSAEQLKSKIMGLDGRDSLILDLRKMQSGDYSESFRIADLFTDSGNLGYLYTKTEGDRSFPADSNRFHTGKLIVIIGRNPTPFSEIIAMALKGRPQVTIIGPQADTSGAFIAKSIRLTGDYELKLTAGYIKNPEGKPLYENPVTADVVTGASLPGKPPLDTPDPSDEAQVAAAGLLGIRIQ